MTPFSPDLLRQFGIGFLIGAILVAAANWGEWSEGISPPAQAAEMPSAPAPADDFWVLEA